MPSHVVLQPNGKYAIWSTIVDSFLALDLTKDEAIQASCERSGCLSNYPGGPAAYREAVESEFEHIEKSGTAWDWAGDWNSRVSWLEELESADMLKIIDGMGLPRRMKRTVSALKRERYWRYYWRNKCEDQDIEIGRMGRANRINSEQLSAALARIARLEEAARELLDTAYSMGAEYPSNLMTVYTEDVKALRAALRQARGEERS